MQDTQFFLNNLWKWKCGLPEDDYNQAKTVDKTMTYESLRKTEWSDEFENLMRNRLLMGAFRYGKIREQNKPNYMRMQSAERRMKLYEETGNDELLVDIANLCLLEFMIGKHPKKHFNSIDDGEHAEIK